VIPELRRQFNQRWTEAAYSELLASTEAMAGTGIGFRICETPVFLPAELFERMVRYGHELYGQLVGNEEYRRASEAAVPPAYRQPAEATEPEFLQVDFGLTANSDGDIEPKLVEIQGFPSIYAFQIAMAQEFERVYRLRELDSELTTYASGFVYEGYRNLLGRAILGGHAPEDVALLEIDPYEQKTLPDFLLTQKLLGIRIADIRKVEKRGKQLYLNGRVIRRIYNRVIADELIRKDVKPAFQFSEELDVEWTGHPDWFFRISKFSLPWLNHPSVPETYFLDDLTDFPEDLNNWVLKPLYSFAGQGVTIGPSRDDIAAIAEARRNEYILQRKMNFIPTVNTPAGPTKVEIRIMYVRDGAEMKPVTSLLRLGRGKMMGVDFNKNLDWVGASAGFWSPRW
jgi:hypothetical protein